MGRTLCCDRERQVMGDSIFTGYFPTLAAVVTPVAWLGMIP